MQIYACPGNEALADGLARALGAERGAMNWRHFPDGETLVHIQTPPRGDAWLVCTLVDPDAKALPLLFAADALHAQGAGRVGLVAPYLAYMRQDNSFKPGEAVSARHFGALLAEHLDMLVTVDPHLHRLASLDEVFPRPNRSLQAAPLLTEWIRTHVDDPLLIGPDAESAQWVSAVAERLGAPWTHLVKQRLGDREVKAVLKDIPTAQGRRPVLLDDIISTGHTLVEAARALRDAGLTDPACVAVHGLFAGDARRILQSAGIGPIAVTNSVLQPESAIDLTPLLAAGMRELRAEPL